MSDVSRVKIPDIESVQIIRDYMKEQRRIFIEEHADLYERIIENLKKSGMSERERKLAEEHTRILDLKK